MTQPDGRQCGGIFVRIPKDGLKLKIQIGQNTEGETVEVEINGVALVPTPTCCTCGTKLVPASPTSWECPNSPCPEWGENVHVDGIFPYYIARRGM
jgi:hypothetical protein